MSKLRWRMLWAFLGVIVIFVACVLYVRAFGGHIRGYEVSPDGREIAEWIETGESSATTTSLTSVALRTKSNPIRHIVFSGLDYGGRIHIQWIDPENLLVTCDGCKMPDHITQGATNISILRKQTNWGNVSIHYVIQ